MKRITVLALLLSLPVAGFAQGLQLGDPQPAEPPAPDQVPVQNCTTVTAGNSVAYGCINQQQRDLVRQHQAALAATEPGPNSAPQSLGLFNQAATKEHLGTSFGHSSVNQAVPPPNYTNPLVPPPR
jgi:hypothetical protein